MKSRLIFEVVIKIDSAEHIDGLGKELAAFLEESFFNGEDVITVNYKGHERILWGITMRIVDLQLNIDGLILKDNESVEDFINLIRDVTNSAYDIQYQVLYEESD